MLGLLGLVATAGAEEFGSPSLLPLPNPTLEYPAAQVGLRQPTVPNGAPSPSDRPPVVAAEPIAGDCPTQAPVSDYQQALNDGQCGDNYGACNFTPSGYWFGSAGGLIMQTTGRNVLNTSIDTGNYNTVLSTNDTRMLQSGGFDGTIGRMFCGGCAGVMVNYWGVFPQQQSASVDYTQVTGQLNSQIDFSPLSYNDTYVTNNLSYWFNNARQHQLITSQSFNSVEINLIGNSCNGGLWGCSPWGCGTGACGVGCGGGACAPRLGYGWLGGIRYFNFNDNFLFRTDSFDKYWTGDPREVAYHVKTTNNLIGFQLGGGLNYRVINCFSVYGIGRAGIYNNHSTQSQYFTGNITPYETGGFYAGQNFAGSGSANSLAFLGQIDLGGRYQFSKCLSVNAGYRLLGVSGVALTESQIPRNFANLGSAQSVNHSYGLLLHGVYVGGAFCF